MEWYLYKHIRLSDNSTRWNNNKYYTHIPCDCGVGQYNTAMQYTHTYLPVKQIIDRFLFMCIILTTWRQDAIVFSDSPDTKTIFSSETTWKIIILFEKIPLKYTSLCSDLSTSITARRQYSSLSIKHKNGINVLGNDLVSWNHTFLECCMKVHHAFPKISVFPRSMLYSLVFLFINYLWL